MRTPADVQAGGKVQPLTPASFKSNSPSSSHGLEGLDISGMIWGTNIDSERASDAFGQFIRHFKMGHELLADREARRDAFRAEHPDEEVPLELLEAGDAQIEADMEEQEPYYESILSSLLLSAPVDGNAPQNVGINAQHLQAFGKVGQDLYMQLVRYPQEIIPLMDIQMNGEQ